MGLKTRRRAFTYQDEDTKALDADVLAADYSPLDYDVFSQCEVNARINQELKLIGPGRAATVKPPSGDCIGPTQVQIADLEKLYQPIKDPKDPTKLITPNLRPLPSVGEYKPGSSFQSQHARAMALRGVALADQFCTDFFSSKANFQMSVGFVGDVTSSAGSLAAGAAGAATGAAGLPSLMNIITGISTSTSGILNKDILFDQANISETYSLVAQALSKDTAAALPEPDESNWNFQQALTVVAQHQRICHPQKIIALLKDVIAKATLTATQTSTTSADKDRPANRTQEISAQKAESPPANPDATKK